ncbi:MAG TPA: hypothetical protein VFU29_03235 [Chitinophagaceae bacterium]|nr:hypothetical protein [Chitinophagaceae bacterium]
MSKIFVLKNIPFPGEGKEERTRKLSSFEYTQNLLTEIETLIIAEEILSSQLLAQWLILEMPL